jgi:hypothetical protein
MSNISPIKSYAKLCALEEYNKAIAFCKHHNIPEYIMIKHANMSANVVYFRSLIFAQSINDTPNVLPIPTKESLIEQFEFKESRNETKDEKISVQQLNEEPQKEELEPQKEEPEPQKSEPEPQKEEPEPQKSEPEPQKEEQDYYNINNVPSDEIENDDNENEWKTIPIKQQREIVWTRNPYQKYIKYLQEKGVKDKSTGKYVTTYTFKNECASNNVKFEWNIHTGVVALKASSREKLNIFVPKFKAIIESIKLLV